MRSIPSLDNIAPPALAPAYTSVVTEAWTSPLPDPERSRYVTRNPLQGNLAPQRNDGPRAEGGQNAQPSTERIACKATPPAPRQVKENRSRATDSAVQSAARIVRLPEVRNEEARTIRHRVVDGDSLESLALKYLGSEGFAGEIFEANREQLESPDLLPIGIELAIASSSSRRRDPLAEPARGAGNAIADSRGLVRLTAEEIAAFHRGQQELERQRGGLAGDR